MHRTGGERLPNADRSKMLAPPEDTNPPEQTRREKLLWIAAKYFLTKGYSATSVDEIAEAAGTSGPALYRLFESKQDLLDQVCLSGVEARQASLQEAVAMRALDPHVTLRALVRARIDFAFGPWASQVPITLAEYRHLSQQATKKLDAASQIGATEWFRCLASIRPEASTKDLLSTIYTVLMEITYVAMHIETAGIEGDTRSMLENLAMAALTGEGRAHVKP